MYFIDRIGLYKIIKNVLFPNFVINFLIIIGVTWMKSKIRVLLPFVVYFDIKPLFLLNRVRLKNK